ncbi:hypothetical protein [Streptomyces sp. NPDC048637]|uniref:hypothetical protein n=1 Tax=Streptomyces sp. NPDC048637 TaxID=3155636 RepID=UPI003418EC3D
MVGGQAAAGLRRLFAGVLVGVLIGLPFVDLAFIGGFRPRVLSADSVGGACHHSNKRIHNKSHSTFHGKARKEIP